MLQATRRLHLRHVIHVYIPTMVLLWHWKRQDRTCDSQWMEIVQTIRALYYLIWSLAISPSDVGQTCRLLARPKDIYVQEIGGDEYPFS